VGLRGRCFSSDPPANRIAVTHWEWRGRQRGRHGRAAVDPAPGQSAAAAP